MQSLDGMRNSCYNLREFIPDDPRLHVVHVVEYNFQFRLQASSQWPSSQNDKRDGTFVYNVCCRILPDYT